MSTRVLCGTPGPGFTKNKTATLFLGYESGKCFHRVLVTPLRKQDGVLLNEGELRNAVFCSQEAVALTRIGGKGLLFWWVIENLFYPVKRGNAICLN